MKSSNQLTTIIKAVTNLYWHKLFFGIFLLSICIGCEKVSLLSNLNKDLSITIGFDTFGISKSGCFSGNIVDINLFIFDANQELIEHLYLINSLSTTLQLSYGIKTIAAIANVGNLNFSSCNNLSNLRLTTHNTMVGTGGNVIYSGELTQAISPNVKSLIIPLTRIFSKITYVFDKSNLDPQVDVIIKKIQLKNTPTECSFFSVNTPNIWQIAHSGDALEGGNLEPLNHDEALPLYMFENRQGTIGTSYTPIDKNPGYKADICTFVEITADYNSPYKTGTIIYKNYLGLNTTNNFDIIRGNHYKETIVFNGTSINEISWRVDVSNLTDISTTIPVTGISLESSSLKLITGTTHQLNATIYPLDATNQNYTYHSSNPNIIFVNPITGSLTTKMFGSSIITVRSEDGTFEDSCFVEVYDPITLYVDTYPYNQNNPETNEIESCEVILFVRANFTRPSNMSIIQAIEPYINVNVSYSYTIKNITHYKNGTLKLDPVQNYDYLYLGYEGTYAIITFEYPIESNELYAAIESISIEVIPGSVYTQNWYVTWGE